jgi:hypothetical protein
MTQSTVRGTLSFEAALQKNSQTYSHEKHFADLHLFQCQERISGKLPLNKTVYYAATGETKEVEHWYAEEQTSILFGKNAVYHPRGVLSVENILFLECLTPSFVDHEKVHSNSGITPISLKWGLAGFGNADLEAVNSLDDHKIYACPYVYASSNFGHWHYNTVASLHLINKHLPDSMLLFPPLAEYQIDSLDLLGIDMARVTILKEASPVAVPNFAFPSSASTWNGIPNPRLSLSMMHNMAKMCNDMSNYTPFSNRIYISRIADGRRSISNEDEVCKIFEKYGFSIISPTKYKYEHLMCIFKNADFIAGPTGSALTRVGFCRPGFKLLQLTFEGSHDYLWHCNACHAGAGKSYTYVEEKSRVTYLDANINPNEIMGWSINALSLERFLIDIFA